MLTHKAKRNVLLILTDQQRWDAIGYVNPSIKTPNLNRLAKESIVCGAAYSQSPQCQPSRASIMTGRYPTAHKVWWNNIDLPRNEKTIGNYLRADGYVTGFFGKAHFSNYDRKVIDHFGFDHHYLFNDWTELNNKKSWDSERNNILPIEEYHAIMNTKTWTGKLQSSRGIQHEDVITDRFIEWWGKSREPTFGVVSFIGPHPPYAAPEPFSNIYNPNEMTAPHKSINGMSKEEWQLLKSQYYGMITWIDDNIGKILKVIDDDTIIIFTSDHGDILGDHGEFSKGLFVYEGNTRVPLIFRNNKLKPLKYSYLVQSIDILPTIFNMLGVHIPHEIQGKSLLHGFINNKSINNYILSMIGFHKRIRMIRSGNYKYWIGNGQEALYNLQLDPLEQQNIILEGQEEQKLNEIRKLFINALIEAEDPTPMPT